MDYPIISGNSFTVRSGYIPQEFSALDKLLACKQDTGIHIHEPELAEHVDNMSTKLGFILLSKEYLVQCSTSDQTRMNYFLNNFVYDVKAFLDSVSVVLNYFYYLQFEGGSIDLKWSKFRDAISTNNKNLGDLIKTQEKWILDVIEWREELIHRISAPIIFYGTGDEMKANKLRTKMPVIPITISELQRRHEELKSKYGSIDQEILPFCDRWIDESKKLFEMTCKSIVEDSGGLMNIAPKRPKNNLTHN